METLTTQAVSLVSFHRREAKKSSYRATAGYANTDQCRQVKWLLLKLVNFLASGLFTLLALFGVVGTGEKTVNCGTRCGIVWSGRPSCTLAQ